MKIIPFKKDELNEVLHKETEKIVTFYEDRLEETTAEIAAKDLLIKQLKNHNESLRKSVSMTLAMLYQVSGKGLH